MTKERRLEIQKKYRDKHRDKLKKDSRAYYLKHKDRCNLYQRNWYRKNYKRQLGLKYRRLYGISPEELKILQEKQGGRCAICKNERPLNLDHDHKTNKVRGLLCQQCNTALGMLNDSPVLFQRAIDYLMCLCGDF